MRFWFLVKYVGNIKHIKMISHNGYQHIDISLFVDYILQQ